MSPIFKDYSDEFNIQHLQGDLHYIEPSDKYSALEAGQNYDIAFKGGFWQISEFDSPPNFYIAATGQTENQEIEPRIIDSTRALIDPESGLELMTHVDELRDANKQLMRSPKDSTVMATAAQLFQKNVAIDQIPIDVTQGIIPQVNSLKSADKNPDGSIKLLDISRGLKLDKNEFFITQTNPALIRLARLGLPLSDAGIPLIFEKVSGLDAEAYRLVVGAEKIEIQSTDAAGAFYALQSLAGLYQPGVNSLPQLSIEDAPRYHFRGFHLDVARNFRGRNFVISLLDQMAAYKLNRFHLHLGDDEGWRLEIPGLPELTQLGAVRCHDLSETRCLLPQLGNGPGIENPNNGFFSISDYQKILQEAKKRHIQVIPSFDMPGHSRAAVRSMQLRYKRLQAEGKLEQAKAFLLSDPEDASRYSSVQFYDDNTINVCQESSYRFVEKVIGEVAKIHQTAGVPLQRYHIGADETPGAWKDSPLCQEFIAANKLKVTELGAYFIERVAAFLDRQGIEAGAWSDGLSKVDPAKMPSKVQANAWTPLFWGGHKVAHQLANHGWELVVSIPDVTYFDFPYQADPKERGYYWGSRYTDTRKVFELMPDNLPIHAEIWTDREGNPMILDDRPTIDDTGKQISGPRNEGVRFSGLQGHLWSEMVRSDQIAAYLIFPRLLALAERAWHKADWEPEYRYSGDIYSSRTNFFGQANRQLREQDWHRFASIVANKELNKLAIDGWFFRLPTVGARLETDVKSSSEGAAKSARLLVNSAFPGLPLEYRQGEGGWQNYSQGGVTVDPELPIWVRSKSPDGARKSRALAVTD